MPRKADPSSRYRLKVHRTHGYQYASTQYPVTDSETGIKRYRHKHWGRVDADRLFYPNEDFLALPAAEREKMIFPSEWDLSELASQLAKRGPGRPSYRGPDVNRFYGDIWLLERIAEKVGLTKDLEKVFAGDREMVRDVLTLAMFPYLTGKAYNHVEAWQELGRFPSCHNLSPAAVTRITQAITEQNRMDLIRLRRKHMKKGELCALDSTSRSAYGGTLRDVTWGKNKERLPLPQTVEVVVYSLSSHMPLYYRSFPGNMPDVRSLETILKDLHDADFKDYILVTDRGYESAHNMNLCIKSGQAFVSASKVQLKRTRDRIASMGDFGAHPPDMTWDAANEVYAAQYKEDLSGSGRRKAEESLFLDLYFDPVLRAKAQVQLANTVAAECDQLQILKDEGTAVTEDTIRAFSYCSVTLDSESSAVVSWEVDTERVRKAEQTQGFFALLTYGVDVTAAKALALYRLRDEQEKYFSDMKTVLLADTQQNWSEKGKTGRLFILFVGLILVSQLKHVWKTTELFGIFPYSFGIIEEMRRIRCIEHTGRAKFITPFIGKQIRVCEAFGFEIPKGCSPTTRKSASKDS